MLPAPASINADTTFEALRVPVTSTYTSALLLPSPERSYSAAIVYLARYAPPFDLVCKSGSSIHLADPYVIIAYGGMRFPFLRLYR